MTAAPAMPEELRAELGEHAEQTWLLFDSFLPVGQQWFNAKEFADLVGVHERTIRNGFTNPNTARRLLGFSFNFGGGTDWDRKLFPRWAVTLALIKRANFDLTILLTHFDELVGGMSTNALDHLICRATAERARR